MIKAVFFDVDGVLIDSSEVNYHFYRQLFSVAGYTPPNRKQYQQLAHMTMRDAIATWTKLKSEDEITRIWKLGKDGTVPYPRNLLKSPEDAFQVVVQLSKSYKVGIVTNKLKEGLFGIPILKQLQSRLEVVIAYEDTKKHKPDPEPLLLACKKLGVNPSETVYIGDAEGDLLAGKAAGCKTILFGQKKFGNPDAYTSSFKQLPKIIKNFDKS